MRPSRILAVAPGAAQVAGGLFAAGVGGRLTLQHFAIERLNPDPAMESSWIEQTATALAALAGRLPFDGGTVLGVPGHLAFTKFIRTPAIERTKRAKVIQFEASQNIPHPLAEVVWDHVVVADDGLDLEVLLMAVKADAMLALCAAARTAGNSVVRALPACLALRQSFAFNYPENQDSVLLVNVGARSTQLVFHQPGRFFVRTLPLAGNAVTRAVADELRLDFNQAESLKIQVCSGRSELPEEAPARVAVRRAAEIFSTRLQLEIMRSLVNLRRQATASPPVAIHLAGGGAAIAPLPALLEEKLKLPVQRYDALRRVDLAPPAKSARAPENAPLLADLVGLATRLAMKGETAATLLPASLGEALINRRRRPALLAAAALAALALLPPLWHYHRLVLAAQAESAGIDAQLRPLRSVQSRNAGNLEQIDRAQRRIAALHGLAETKANWINFLGDLQGRLAEVEDVWLERLSVLRGPPPDSRSPRSAAASPAPLRLTLSGRLLDVHHPVAKVSTDSLVRVKRLLASFAGSPFIAAVEGEHFDNRQPGILRFEFTLVVSPRRPL